MTIVSQMNAARRRSRQPTLPMVHSGMAHPFLIEALNRGFAAEPFLAPTGLTYGEVQTGEGLLSGQHWYDLVEAISDEIADPYLGFRVGAETAMDLLPNLDVLKPEEATLGEVLTALVIDAARLTSLARYSLEIHGGTAKLVARRTFKPARPPGQIDALFTGIVTRLLRMACRAGWESGAFRAWVCVPAAIPVGRGPRITVLGGSLRGARFEFPSEWLLTRFGGVQQQPVHGRGDDSGEFLTQVTRLLDLHLHDPALSLDRFAALTSRSVGQVKRALAAHGTNFTEQLSARRRGRAIALVTNSDLPLRAVGEQIGFPDPTGFNRVFRRWTGTSPGRYRQEARKSRQAIKP